MRDIKFRGKRIGNGEWVYGTPAAEINVTIMVYDVNFETGDATDPDCWDVKAMAIDPATVGQYTGLKDKNGKEIYEGDILGGDFTLNKYVVRWDKYKCAFDCDTFGYLPGWLNSFTTGIEVVGNIHDNPELLKEKNNG